MMMDPGVRAVSPARSLTKLFVPLAIGIAVSVTLGVYGGMHTPSKVVVNVTGFSGPLEAKVWLTTGAFTFALLQLVSALVMYGKVPGVRGPAWIGGLHRWSGRIAFLFSLPVAVHCLYGIGFATYDLRSLAHSLAGTFFFGVFTVKMLILPRRDVPGWALPVFGGFVFTGLTVLWLTSSVWYFTTFGVKF